MAMSMRLIASILALLIALRVPAMSQAPVDSISGSMQDLTALAKQLPSCKAFKTDCEVCIKMPDEKFGCSNVGIACNPSGVWRCAEPITTDQPAK